MANVEHGARELGRHAKVMGHCSYIHSNTRAARGCVFGRRRVTGQTSVLPSELLADIQRDWKLQEYGRALTRMGGTLACRSARSVAMPDYATILGHCSRFQFARSPLDEIVLAQRRSDAYGRLVRRRRLLRFPTIRLGRGVHAAGRRRTGHPPQCFTDGPRPSNVSTGCLRPRPYWSTVRRVSHITPA